MLVISVLFLVVVLLEGASGFPSFADLIPNARKVKVNGVTVFGLGHPFNDRRTSSSRANQFGKDVEDAARRLSDSEVWQAVCDLDSDGDGLTNGVELCDPDCIAAPGSITVCPEGFELTHPGRKEDVSTEQPTDSPTIDTGGTFFPTASPTFEPTSSPTNVTLSPVESPTESPVVSPTFSPTSSPVPGDDANLDLGSGDLENEFIPLVLFTIFSAATMLYCLFSKVAAENREAGSVSTTMISS